MLVVGLSPFVEDRLADALAFDPPQNPSLNLKHGQGLRLSVVHGENGVGSPNVRDPIPYMRSIPANTRRRGPGLRHIEAGADGGLVRPGDATGGTTAGRHSVCRTRAMVCRAAARAGSTAPSAAIATPASTSNVITPGFHTSSIRAGKVSWAACSVIGITT